MIRGAKSTDQIVAFDFEYGSAVVCGTPNAAAQAPSN
jgi:hypothetical protein